VHVTIPVACTFDLPPLVGAMHLRGMRLVPFAPGVEAGAALLAGDADSVGPVRARGWQDPLLLLLPRGASVAQALDAGADDAMPHSADPEEIAARIAARLRQRPEIVLGELRIDPVERRVTRAGRTIALLPREYALLLHLIRQGERPAGRGELLAAVWGLAFDPGTNVVEVHVSRLRAKLDRGFAAPMLVTDKGRGYRLCAA
jgi:two-component system OmpR family response regulator